MTSLSMVACLTACTDAALQSTQDSLVTAPRQASAARVDGDSGTTEGGVTVAGRTSFDTAPRNASAEHTDEATHDAAAVPTQCELDVEWRDVAWSSDTCVTFSPTTGFTRGTWNGHGLQLDTAPPHVLDGNLLVAAFTCYQPEGLWRFVEHIALPSNAANLCDGEVHSLSYAYQECRILPEVSYMCLITEDSCQSTTELSVRRANFAPSGATFVAPSNLVAEAACYNDQPPKADGAVCGDSAECQPGSYCDVSGDAACFVGSCTPAPQYLSCEEADALVCDCFGYPIPQELAANTCQANALGVATRPCAPEIVGDAGTGEWSSLDGG